MIPSLCTTLQARGFRLFSIGKPTDSHDFFRQAKAAYPFDPDISGNVHWDAFADSLWGGLDACAESRIALIIQDATEFAENSAGDYKLALSCLADAATGVETDKRAGGDEHAEIIIVVGLQEPPPHDAHSA
jgi:hypothetical protein